MGNARKVRLGDRDVAGVDVGYTITKNDVVDLALEDGRKLRLRPIVVSVTRTDEHTPDGDPVYVVQHFVYVSVVRDEPQENEP